jgi:uncharacterized protein
MSAPDPVGVPTQDERTMAMLAHALQLVAGFLAPLIIFVLRPNSRFVRFHALEALLYQGLYALVVVGLVAVWIVTVIVMAATSAHRGQPPIWLILLFPLLWGTVFFGWIVTFVLAIVYAIKASRGEWAAYPVVGGWARRMLHL